MSWNDSNGQDPWRQRRKNEPPDLDALFNQFMNKLGGTFGGKKSGDSGKNNRANFKFGVILLIILGIIAWFFSGIYIVDEGERGVVLQFGKYKTTTQPGPHWHPSIIQTVEQINIARIREADGRAQILTGDENIVQLSYSIQYNVKDAAEYLFNVLGPDATLEQVAESAFREIVGKNSLDYVIQDGRNEVPAKVKQLLQEILDQYVTGLDVINVNLIDAQPPQEVQNAFDDAIKAREDKDRFIKEAQAYSNSVIPDARGDARKQLEEAKAYRFSTIAAAQGEADRFLKLLTEYNKAPQITRKRLYLETLEDVLSKTSKILIDNKNGSGQLLYLPLDKMLSGQGRVFVEPGDNVGNRQNFNDSTQPSTNNDDRFRTREVR